MSKLESWESGPVCPTVWAQLARFHHPVYTDGQPVLVGDCIRCSSLDQKYRVVDAVYCVLSIHCERRGVSEVAFVVVGDPMHRPGEDDILYCTEKWQGASVLCEVQPCGRMVYWYLANKADPAAKKQQSDDIGAQ